MNIFCKPITDSSLNMFYAGIFVKRTFSVLFWNKKKACKPEQRESWDRMSYAMSWRSG